MFVVSLDDVYVFNVVLTDPLSVSKEETCPSNVVKSLSIKKLPVFDSIESTLPLFDDVYVFNVVLTEPLSVSNESNLPSKEPTMVSIDDENVLNGTEPLNIPSFHVGTPLKVTSVLLSVAVVVGNPPPTVAVT